MKIRKEYFFHIWAVYLLVKIMIVILFLRYDPIISLIIYTLGCLGNYIFIVKYFNLKEGTAGYVTKRRNKSNN